MIMRTIYSGLLALLVLAGTVAPLASVQALHQPIAYSDSDFPDTGPPKPGPTDPSGPS